MHTRHIRSIVGALAGFVACSVAAGFALTIGALPAVGSVARAANSGLTDFASMPSDLTIPTLDQSTTFYAQDDGKPVRIATFYAQNRVLATWKQVSPKIKDAVLAAEDPDFYHEGAVSIRGTVRAAVQTIFDDNLQGGSTITQQYVKNVRTQLCTEEYAVPTDASSAVRQELLKEEQSCDNDAAGATLSRKVQELRYATALEKKYSKKQILLGYLNIAFFGGETYGIEAAAHYYFGVDADHVTIAQAATLASMVNEPNVMRIDENAKEDPTNNSSNGFATTLARRNYVLAQMLKYGDITHAQYETALATKITPKITAVHAGCYAADTHDAGFFCNYAEQELLSTPSLGKTALARLQTFQQGGLKVYTTLNLNLQKSAQTALSDYVPPTRPGIDLGGAQVALKVGTGQIVSMVQNRAYDDRVDHPTGTTSVNYNTDFGEGGSAGFQTGSSFKPFVLAAWLEAGNTLEEDVNASNHFFAASDFHSSCSSGWGSWEVQNAEPWEGGTMSVLSATEQSVNTAYVDMESQLDLCAITSVAKSLLVHSASPATNPWVTEPSMVLGSNYISPLTMATAYAAFADGGTVCTPVAITKIERTNGTTLAPPTSTCTQAIPANIANTIAYALQKVITSPSGTAVTANPNDGTPILAKTGTTDNSFENWLVTSTTNVASALWVGNIQGDVNMLDMYFQDHGTTGPKLNGMNVKFAIDKLILHALDEDYGGSTFAAPDASMVGGATETSTTEPTEPPVEPTEPQQGAAVPPTQTQPAAPPTTQPTAPPAADLSRSPRSHTLVQNGPGRGHGR